LVTADKRHYAKTQVLGNICLLSELEVWGGTVKRFKSFW
jgi:hypothetical protein